MACSASRPASNLITPPHLLSHSHLPSLPSPAHAQIVGAILGSAFVMGMVPNGQDSLLGSNATAPGVSNGGAFLGEVRCGWWRSSGLSSCLPPALQPRPDSALPGRLVDSANNPGCPANRLQLSLCSPPHLTNPHNAALPQAVMTFVLVMVVLETAVNKYSSTIHAQAPLAM